MSLDDSEIENELASLPASRETRWEQVYVDGDTKLVQRACGDIGVHDFATQEPKEICITTPPGEMESSFLTNRPTDGAPLSFSSLQPIDPIEPVKPQPAQNSLQEPHDISPHHDIGSKASFSDRVHHMAQAQAHNPSPTISPQRSRNSAIPDTTVLADLEHEVDLASSVSTSTAPSRVGTGFSIFDLPDRAPRVGTGFSIARGHRFPAHQDSGFDEPMRVSYESERIRHSLDESINDFNVSKVEEQMINERLWDEKDGTLFGEGVRGEQLEIKPTDPFVSMLTSSAPVIPATTATIPTISFPLSTVGPSNVIQAEAVKDKALEERNSNTTIRPPSILIPEFHHGIPKVVDHMNNNPMTPPFSGTYQDSRTATRTSDHSYSHEYLEPSSLSRPQSRDHSTTAKSDLDDYLSHSISYSSQQGEDFLAQFHAQREKESLLGGKKV